MPTDKRPPAPTVATDHPKQRTVDGSSSDSTGTPATAGPTAPGAAQQAAVGADLAASPGAPVVGLHAFMNENSAKAIDEANKVFTGRCTGPQGDAPAAPVAGEPAGDTAVIEEKRRAGIVSHAKAREIAQRFVDAAFNNPGTKRPEFSIPADPRRDSDIRMAVYIDQREAKERAAEPAQGKTEGQGVSTKRLFVEILHDLRASGWMVAVHNDYRLNGKRMTFWLLTHDSGRWIKGEGSTDTDALEAAWNWTAGVPARAASPAAEQPPTQGDTDEQPRNDVRTGTAREGATGSVTVEDSHAHEADAQEVDRHLRRFGGQGTGPVESSGADGVLRGAQERGQRTGGAGESEGEGPREVAATGQREAAGEAPKPKHVCRCSNGPCPACGLVGTITPSEWSEGDEVRCDNCDARLGVAVVENCLGSTTFEVLPPEPDEDDGEDEDEEASGPAPCSVCAEAPSGVSFRDHECPDENGFPAQPAAQAASRCVNASCPGCALCREPATTETPLSCREFYPGVDARCVVEGEHVEHRTDGGRAWTVVVSKAEAPLSERYRNVIRTLAASRRVLADESAYLAGIAAMADEVEQMEIFYEARGTQAQGLEERLRTAKAEATEAQKKGDFWHGEFCAAKAEADTLREQLGNSVRKQGGSAMPAVTKWPQRQATRMGRQLGLSGLDLRSFVLVTARELCKAYQRGFKYAGNARIFRDNLGRATAPKIRLE